MRKKLVLASLAAKGEYEVESTPCAAVQCKIDIKNAALSSGPVRALK